MQHIAAQIILSCFGEISTSANKHIHDFYTDIA